ncbi:hypothetical protein [Metapseudomonas resinovorans]|uniref:Uncharacterized protein n=1 Tax=Metapseudomonas resinovorans NBRC 106553 TaxID=1245471 RepID=S6B0H5_METRE|nr:hypothetical protein [Pseudomonas resinovorans]BAN50726.1 hypothetical protein PCA10_49940 [Pseudomonas resinovorans NBRC 106553]
MSLLSPESCIAVLGPRSVGLYRCRDRQWLAGAEFDGAPAWPAALAALEPLLAGHKGGRVQLRVVLSSHYTRFCLVPWSDAINSPEELAGYARLCFEDIYGALGESWSLRLSAEAAGLPRLAAAMPEELLAGLRALAKANGLRLASVQPYLMAAFNRYRARLAADDFLFLVAEPGRGSLLLARGGRWSAVRSVALDGSDDALEHLIAREAELQGLEQDVPAALYLHAPGRAVALAGGVAHLDAELPHGRQADPLHAMAMTVN